MTSKSTNLYIVDALKSGLLVKRSALRPLIAVHPRNMYVTPQINETLDRGLPDAPFPIEFADQIVGQFVAGQQMLVALRRPYAMAPDLERLDDFDEVWSLGFRRPRPGFRLLGRFIQKNDFIGLGLFDRHDLGSDFAPQAEQVITGWENVFKDVEPLRGNVIGDYLGGVWIDAGKKIE